MATYTTRLEPPPFPPGIRRPMYYSPISDNPRSRNIVKRRPHAAQSHPNWDILKQHWRRIARWAGGAWHQLTTAEQESWLEPLFSYYPGTGDPSHANMISANCYNWAQGDPLQASAAVSPLTYSLENVNLTAIRTGPGTLLNWNQNPLVTPPPTPWVITIVRMGVPELESYAECLLAAIPSKSIGAQSYLDTHPLPSSCAYFVKSYQRDATLGHEAFYFLE